ncbi:ABC transporter ATP-binding protein [Mechercharimyces sp. CAU 1602]|uniref:ABC transporter ATP-binding protein n=1 Tax=Mechercharimyces sp. CAU 1602 TaxID=2973933 RepID=UPI0021626532|nr:ABC transporter ATP-binding protein [Mechercharimyces sp. CAU 1602]MCS1352534.1 ABC transporter ATP-binding protein [Mechercharimyces sp. CAU 1602]
MQKQPVLQLQHLTKKIGKKTIIHDLSMDIYPGEVFGFLGPNGAGKTTTIRMIVGLMGMTSGKVIINGINLKQDFAKAISQVGAIVENPELYPFLTGHQNLVHYWRMCSGVNRRRINHVIRLVGLEKRIHEKVKTYSLGMRQRLGLAQALLHSPSVLILDEPTNGLDPAGIREIRQYLRKLTKEENIAIIVSSHLLSEMEMMCDRIGIIQEGKLVDIKEIREFVSAETEQKIMLEVEPIAEAKRLLATYLPDQKPVLTDDGLQLALQREQIPELVHLLVSHQIAIYSIQPTTLTLEDKFLEVTGGTNIG